MRHSLVWHDDDDAWAALSSDWMLASPSIITLYLIDIIITRISVWILI